jgi:two-component system chemotaxis response regulator CheB
MSARILVVDDSATARLALRMALESHPGLHVVAEAADRAEALARARRLRPDIITMDVFLRRENGLDVAAAIMAESPCPILVVTGGDTAEPGLIYRALEVGALDICAKPPSPRHPRYQQQRSRLIRLVTSLAGVPVVRRRRPVAAPAAIPPAIPPATPPAMALPDPEPQRTGNAAALLIGASTGGPPVLRTILASLGPDLPVPALVVQHIAPGFTEGLATWLTQTTGLPTTLVRSATRLEPGTVYLPAGDGHLVVVSRTSAARSDAPPRAHQRPSIDVLLESAAATLGADAVAVLLTGMGSDGAEGMAALHAAGALTLVQAPATCAVDSMPRSAIARGAVTAALAPGALAEAALKHLSRRPRPDTHETR